MIDRKQVYERFAESYGASRPADLVKLFHLRSSTISNWKTGKKPIPWDRLKAAVDEHNLKWDWLLEGKVPKTHRVRKASQCDHLDRDAIGQRFLKAFEVKSQAEMAKLLGITPVAVHYMYKGLMKVPWDKLSLAVDMLEISWEWLLEGRGAQKKAPRKGGAKK